MGMAHLRLVFEICSVLRLRLKISRSTADSLLKTPGSHDGS